MFWTEKQIEAFLEDETRELVDLSGRAVRVTMFRTYWITYDAVRVDDVYTEGELVELARRRVDAEWLSFTDAFRSNLGLLDREIRRQNGQL